MAIPADLDDLCKVFWDANSSNYDMSTKDGCGQYMEAWVKYAKTSGYPKVENLKKSGSQTQYHGHSIDSFLYADGEGNSGNLYQSVDIVANAESPDANYAFQPDQPRYTANDIWKEPSNPTNAVPWVPYNEQGFQDLKKTLAFDYARRPQGADFDVSVWSARTFHNAYMGPEPEKVPMGMANGTARARKEWCAALQVPVIPVPPGWNIGDPV